MKTVLWKPFGEISRLRSEKGDLFGRMEEGESRLLSLSCKMCLNAI